MSYLESLFSLESKTAVVIGGTGELCGAMAETLAQAGAEVVLVGRSLEKAEKRLAAIEAAGGNGYFIAADIVTRAGLEALLAAHNAEQAAPMWPSVLNGPQLIDKHGGQPYEPGDDYIYWPN